MAHVLGVNIWFFFQTNTTSATIQTNGETKTTLERRETKTSLIPATFDHKFEPQVLFTVTKENQVTIVINQREIHQHAEIVKSEMVWWFNGLMVCQKLTTMVWYPKKWPQWFDDFPKNWPQWFDFQKNDHNGLMISKKWPQWFPKNDLNV